LCNECWRFRLDDAPACARCAFELATRPQRRISLGVAFVAAVLGGVFFGVRRYDLWHREPFGVVLAAIAAPLIGALIARSAHDAKGVRVENRDPDDQPTYEELPDDSAANPYRAGVRRVLQAAAPKVSGSVTALVVGLSLLASAVLLPFGLHLPRWIEAEVVLGTWWAVVATTLVVMLYRGFRLRDDYVYFLPWNRPTQGDDPKGDSPKKSGGFGWADGCSGGVDGEGALIVLAVGAALLLGFGAAWILVELALPLVFLLMYGLMMRAIRRASRDTRGCQGELVRSLGWGALWATIYLCPLALVTWLVHVVRR
jgi:multisubunit Na+/H+ antiporter MnhG subunit